MILALLLAGWMWDRVVTDCHGAPESVSYYVLSATSRITAAGSCCCDQGQPFACPTTIPAPPVHFRHVSDPGAGSTVAIAEDPVGDPGLLPTPPLGGLVGWPWPSPENPDPVIACDRAGDEGGKANCSDEVCP